MDREDWRADVVPHFRWVVRVNGGDIPPDGYGFAAYDPYRDYAYYMPIPLNVIHACWRRVKFWFQFNPIGHKQSSHYRSGYLQGLLAGREQGYLLGVQDCRAYDASDNHSLSA